MSHEHSSSDRRPTPARHSLAIVGAGNMGAAIVRGALNKAVADPAAMVVVEPDDGRRSAMAALGVTVSDRLTAVSRASTVLLAVKPQAFGDVARAMPRLAESTVVISIMAGIESATIRAALGGGVRVVRAMPNTPCQIGAGMTAIALGAGAHPGDEALAMELFSAIGLTELVDESLMHAVTAVSGSGPAYLFLLAETMEAAAASLGFTDAQARRFVAQTILGAARLLSEGGEDPRTLRRAVTSKGGTTEAALAVFEAHRLGDIVRAALTAARDRGAALGSA